LTRIEELLASREPAIRWKVRSLADGRCADLAERLLHWQWAGRRREL
jgi:hypothetical protein